MIEKALRNKIKSSDELKVKNLVHFNFNNVVIHVIRFAICMVYKRND